MKKNALVAKLKWMKAILEPEEYEENVDEVLLAKFQLLVHSREMGKSTHKSFKTVLENNRYRLFRERYFSDSTVFTEAWRSHDSLILHGYDHYRIHHHENEFARGKNHINGIESVLRKKSALTLLAPTNNREINNLHAAEVFVHDRGLVLNMPGFLKEPAISFQEVQ